MTTGPVEVAHRCDSRSQIRRRLASDRADRGWIPRSVAGLRVALTLRRRSLAPLPAGRQPPPAKAIELFEKKVRPILVEKCQKCHGSRAAKRGTAARLARGGVQRGRDGPVIVAGHPEKSELVRAINYEADGFQMPPTGKLDADSIAVVDRLGPRGRRLAGRSSTGGDAVPSAIAIRFCRAGEALVLSAAAARSCRRAWPNRPGPAIRSTVSSRIG